MSEFREALVGVDFVVVRAALVNNIGQFAAYQRRHDVVGDAGQYELPVVAMCEPEAIRPEDEEITPPTVVLLGKIDGGVYGHRTEDYQRVSMVSADLAMGYPLTLGCRRALIGGAALSALAIAVFLIFRARKRDNPANRTQI